MDKPKTLFGMPVKYLFIPFALLILSVPVYMIVNEEVNLRKGTAYKFPVEPVDPVDPFRGRYVDLRFSAEQMKVASASERFSKGDRVYARVSEGNDGFATITRIANEPPSTGDYVSVRIRWISDDRLFLDLPFDRYYMKEEKAKKANDVIRRRAGSDDARVWAKVYVRNGESTLERVFVGNTPIETYISEMEKR